MTPKIKQCAIFLAAVSVIAASVLALGLWPYQALAAIAILLLLFCAACGLWVLWKIAGLLVMLWEGSKRPGETPCNSRSDQ